MFPPAGVLPILHQAQKRPLSGWGHLVDQRYQTGGDLGVVGLLDGICHGLTP
jgi:hypothetical protein